MTPQIALEKAFQSLITEALGNAYPVYCGRASTDKALPCVICQAQGDGEEEPWHSGNYWITMAIMVKMAAGTDVNGQDPEPVNTLLIQLVESAIAITGLDASLNTQGQSLTVFTNGYIFNAHDLTFQREEGVWIDTLPVRVYCCASILQP